MENLSFTNLRIFVGKQISLSLTFFKIVKQIIKGKLNSSFSLFLSYYLINPLFKRFSNKV